MKNVTQTFKGNIKKYGRQLNAIITADDIAINSEALNNINTSFNTSLFKSVMNVLEIDSNIKIDKNSILNAKIGIKFDLDYEYINYNNYKVTQEPEKQEDTLSYKILAYDKMVESMIDYDLELYEEITIREYLIKICQRLGWNTTNIPATFINSGKLVNPSLHIGIQYTFRDVLDEIATITCSFPHFEGNEFYLGYITETNEIIDEEYLSEDDVTIKEKYFINSLVFSRAEESDNIYRKDDENIETNGLHEFRISDNQLLSTNDRDLYIDEMFEYLKTFEFYLYDVKSTGIMFLEVCDRFTFKIHGQTYSTIMLNNEINITQGLEERLYIDEIKETQTDYKCADTTDKKINQTYILVDKQNQKITQLTNEISEYENKVVEVIQDVDGIAQRVENIADTTRMASGVKEITLEKCIKGYLLNLHIYGNNSVFKYLYPANDLLPSNTLYPHGDSRIIVTDENGNSKMYELRVTDVLRANDEVRDEYILENNIARVIRRVNEDGTTKETPEEELIGKYTIYIEQGNNTIKIQNYSARIEARYVQKNSYTDQFATKVEMNSAITQSSEQIQSKVNKTLKDDYSTTQEMESKITQTAEEINTEVRKKVGNNEIISKINQSAETVEIQANKISLSGKTLNLADNMAITSNNFNVDKNGNMTCTNATITGGKIDISSQNDDSIIAINSSHNNNSHAYMYVDADGGGLTIGGQVGNDITIRGGNDRSIKCKGYMEATAYNYTSDARLKSNIEEYKTNALNIINNGKIYKYKFNDTGKDEFGLVIGDKYVYPKQIVELHDDTYSVNAYRMCSVMWKAIQELAQKNKELENRLEELENAKN